MHHKLKDLQVDDTWELVFVLDNFVIGGSFIGDPRCTTDSKIIKIMARGNQYRYKLILSLVGVFFLP